VLAGALLFVAAQGQVITGTLALFVLSLGMGLPLLVIGAGGASLLPRAGNFMEDIKHFFGLVLLLVAAWLAGRLLAPSHLLWVYGIILFGYAITHGATDTNRRLRQTINLLLLFYALLLMVGAAAGGTSLVTPLKPLTHPTPTATPISTSATNPGAAPVAASRPTTGTFETIAGNRLQQELAAAKVGRLPVLVDFFADWCTSCKELDKTTLSNPAVLSAMASFRLLRVDITDINATNRQLMQRFHILGLPCLVFFDTNGVEIPHARVLGYLNSQQWLQHMKMRVLPSI
jgi:thiol:disulfide interchange protein DsbD